MSEKQYEPSMWTFKLETFDLNDQNILILDLLNLREPLNFLLYFEKA